MHLPSFLLIIMLAAALAAGCSATSPPDLTSHPGYHGHGVYVPTTEEQAFDCKSLAFTLGKSVTAINAMPALARDQRDKPPSSMVHAVQRLSGSGIPVLEDYKRERARMKTLQQVNDAKKCPPVDVDAQTKVAAEKLTAFRKDLRTPSSTPEAAPAAPATAAPVQAPAPKT